MLGSPTLFSSLRLLTIASLICLSASAPPVFADPIPSSAVLLPSARDSDLNTIQQALEHKQVRQRLDELGFTAAEIDQRLANANDAELHQLATQSQALLVGGDGGIIISVLLIVLLVMLILRLR